MNRPVKLLFDGAALNSASNLAYKRGIYYVAHNLIKNFIKDSRFDVQIWFEKNFSVESIKNDIILQDVKIIFSKFFIGNGEQAKLINNPKFNIQDYDAYINVGHDMQLSVQGTQPAIFNVLHDCIAILPDYSFYEGTDYPQYFQDFHQKLTSDVWTFCVSENTKKDFLKYFNNLDEHKMFISYNAPAHILCPKNDRQSMIEIARKYNLEYNFDTQYLFFLGAANDPRKNLLYTIECFFKFIDKYNIKNLYFYIGGYGCEVLKKELEAHHTNLYTKYKDLIVFLGFIEEKDINTFYSNSLFFVFLSLYEGFGIPPIEAMQAGTPVICSNNSSLPEVVGESALLVNAKDENEIVDAFSKFYFDEKLRSEYIQKGLKRAKLFSWEKTYKLIADKIIEVVEEQGE